MKKVNVAEMLKDCPKGMELDCLIYENVVFDYIAKDNDAFPIKCHIKLPNNKCSVCSFTTYGCCSLHNYSKCVIFPKYRTTWEGFEPPCQFKDGDIIIEKNKNTICLYKGKHYIDIRFNDFYCGYKFDTKEFIVKEIECTHWGFAEDYRLATEEEKQVLFDVIQANGYKWDDETKSLEKLPKFKIVHITLIC